jgi:hypothetical protein
MKKLIAELCAKRESDSATARVPPSLLVMWLLVAIFVVAGGLWLPSQPHEEQVAPPITHSIPAPIKVAPAARHLTANQITILRDRLFPLSGQSIGVYADMRDYESQRFAQQFFQLFNSIGLNPRKMVGEYVVSDVEPPITVECWTVGHNENQVDLVAPEVQAAMAMRRALIAAGLLSESSKIAVFLKPSLTHKTHFADIFIGPR